LKKENERIHSRNKFIEEKSEHYCKQIEEIELRNQRQRKEIE
jgi:hypothetical protein